MEPATMTLLGTGATVLSAGASAVGIFKGAFDWYNMTSAGKGKEKCFAEGDIPPWWELFRLAAFAKTLHKGTQIGVENRKITRFDDSNVPFFKGLQRTSAGVSREDFALIFEMVKNLPDVEKDQSFSFKRVKMYALVVLIHQYYYYMGNEDKQELVEKTNKGKDDKKKFQRQEKSQKEITGINLLSDEEKEEKLFESITHVANLIITNAVVNDLSSCFKDCMKRLTNEIKTPKPVCRDELRTSEVNRETFLELCQKAMEIRKSSRQAQADLVMLLKQDRIKKLFDIFETYIKEGKQEDFEKLSKKIDKYTNLYKPS